MSLTINAAPVILALNAIAGWNQHRWLRHVGERQQAQVKHRIQSTKIGPDGRAWPPWAASTAAQRTRKGNAERGLLWDSGELLDSIEHDVGAVDLKIGSDVDYAKWHQGGTSRMPAREFLGWTDADIVWTEASLVAHLNGLM